MKPLSSQNPAMGSLESCGRSTLTQGQGLLQTTMDTGSNRRDTRAKPVELKTTRMSLLVAGKIAGSGMVEVDRSAFNPCLHTKPADALSRRQSL